MPALLVGMVGMNASVADFAVSHRLFGKASVSQPSCVHWSNSAEGAASVSQRSGWYGYLVRKSESCFNALPVRSRFFSKSAGEGQP